MIAMKKGITLMELIIAMLLLTAIIFGVSTFQNSSIEFLSSAERKADVLNELTLVLESLNKHILVATGDVSNPGIVVNNSAKTITIRQDLRGDLTGAGSLWIALNTPDNYNNDRKVRFTFNQSSNEIIFEVINSASNVVLREILSKNLVSNPGIAYVNGGVRLSGLALRYKPGESDRFQTRSSMTDTAGSSTTMFFFPLSHSLN